jgi:hypothetical protein
MSNKYTPQPFELDGFNSPIESEVAQRKASISQAQSAPTTAEVLKQARALISDEANWGQHLFARNADGDIVAPEDEDACRFCALGALIRAGQVGNHHRLAALALSIETGGEAVNIFNDTHTHAEVLAAFDAAIAKAGVQP